MSQTQAKKRKKEKSLDFYSEKASKVVVDLHKACVDRDRKRRVFYVV